MAVTLKRKRVPISYKEPSSDDDLSESSDHEQTSQKRLVPSRRSNRRTQAVHHVSGADEHASPEPAPVQRQRSSRTARRQAKRAISYKDISSDEDGEDPDADFEVEAEQVIAMRTRTRPNAPPSSEPQKKRGMRDRNRQRRAVLGAPLAPNREAQAERQVTGTPTDGYIPAWASLPYHVLLQIFVYASHPLHDENMKPTSAIPWLVKMARMCSAFAKPALTALYRNPPIFATRQTRKDLVHHLIAPPLGAYDDYRVMVKRLELDATQMTALTDSSNSVTDLAALMRSLTTLREIDIFDPMDRPPFRPRLRRIRRWVYPNELFDALRQTSLRLRSWRWNRTFCSYGPEWIRSIHTDSAFQSLRDVTFTKFHPEVSQVDSDDGDDVRAQPTTEELLASALAVLPQVRSLSFETCGVVSGRLLPLLPNNLVSLNITNCGELLSDTLQAFLVTHGSQLEELVLNHNQALDLSFLVDLKRSCPKLEVLRMDTTYYSSLVMSSDNEPLYETLLGENEIPTWPCTLRTLDLQYLRNWNSTSAANLFNSLIDSAEDLPWLQEITIIAMVDTDWRQRAEFRQTWSAKFKKVFAKKWEAPDPHLVSMRAFREWKAKNDDDGKVDSFIEGVSEKPLEEADAVTANNHGSDSDSDAPLLHGASRQDEGWGSRRLRSRPRAGMSYDEESDDGSGSEEAAASAEDETLFVQGRCHTVVFRIDNFRPREEIFNEADFLDAEPSGDEEWNGNEDHEHDDGGGYAW